MNKQLIEQIKQDFFKFKEIFAIIIYGSYAKNKKTPKSDIDVCIITKDIKKAKELYNKTLETSAKRSEYDIHFFELLPLHAKAEIIKTGKIIYTKDIYELYYYFYFYRKLWQDQAINRLNK